MPLHAFAHSPTFPPFFASPPVVVVVGGGDRQMQGLFLVTCAISICVGYALVLPVVTKHLGPWKALYMGVSCGIFVGITWATTSSGAVMFLGNVFVIPIGFVLPTLQGLIAREYPPDQQAAVQGGLSSMRTIGSFCGPLFFNGVFSAVVYASPATSDCAVTSASISVGAVYFLLAGISALCCVLIAFAQIERGKDNKKRGLARLQSIAAGSGAGGEDGGGGAGRTEDGVVSNSSSHGATEIVVHENEAGESCVT